MLAKSNFPFNPIDEVYNVCLSTHLYDRTVYSDAAKQEAFLEVALRNGLVSVICDFIAREENAIKRKEEDWITSELNSDVELLSLSIPKVSMYAL